MTDSTPPVKDYVIDVAERAVRTFAQTLAGLYGAGAVGVLHFAWGQSLDVAGGAAIASILTSMAAAPFGEGGTASLTHAVVPRSLVARLRNRHAAPESSYGWYDRGGYIPGGPTPVVNTGKPEHVYTADQVRAESAKALDLANATHPTRKLGKRPTDPNRPVLHMGAHFTAAAFTAPASVDYASKVPSWLLGANDRFGTCGPTSVANLALLVSTLLADAPVTFTDDEIFDLYRRSGNPDFDPATGAGDGGVDMTVMLSELVKNGIGKDDRNIKAVAFGSVDPHDTAKLWAAGCLFGGVLWGADLDTAQQAQTDAGLWDYKRSGQWGGHAILSAPAYSDQPGTLADRTKLVTWAELIAATDAFIDHQVSECYVVLFPWHLGDKRIYEALDMQGVADEYQQLTGRPFPAPIQPPTPEPPAPAPGPAPAPTGFPLAAWEAFSQHPYSRPKERTAIAAVNAWLNGGGS